MEKVFVEKNGKIESLEVNSTKDFFSSVIVLADESMNFFASSGEKEIPELEEALLLLVVSSKEKTSNNRKFFSLPERKAFA